jgi:RES domain-containing protein
LRLWRLTKPEHAPGLDGEGARLWGGRWNSPRVAMVYTASSLALAALEMLVHLPLGMRRTGGFPRLIAVCLDVPDTLIAPIDMASLPADYAVADCRAAGDAWITGGASLGMAVPSRVIIQEMNVILNPVHADMSKVKIIVQEDFHFDDRLGL